MSLGRTILLWGSQNRWLEQQFRKRTFAKRAISRFMPGEDPVAALTAAEALREKRIATVFTCLGENLTSLEEATAIVDDYGSMLDQIAERGLDTHVSIKLTHLGLDLDRDRAQANLHAMLEHAARHGNFVWIDMEASEYVDVTLDVVRAAKAEHPNVGVCLQSYLYRAADDLQDMLDRSIAVRLVKGAYNEPPSVAFPRKQDVDENFFKLAVMTLEQEGDPSQPPAMGTHDLDLIRRIREAAATSTPGRFEVDMLYGIRAEAQRRLADDGVPVRVLISYGEAWFPWYMRRLAERPANIGFVVKSMFAS